MRRKLLCRLLSTVVATVMAAGGTARATPALVMDVATGDVLYQNQATQPWYPASLTKLMTVYVALNAVRAHRIALETPLVVSARAASMPPSRMGFAPGTQVTLDNALKMLMVKSANDIAITVAEGVSGSVEAFAEDMNEAAASLGLHESHFVNPNGLPAPGHVSSARDMAIIARALYRTFPEDSGLFNLGALALGDQILVNHNNMLGRYPGVDGMKTGFTCAAGFNVVASAYRDGRRLVTVILGAPNVAARTAKAAALFDRGFAGIDRPTASIVALPASAVAGPPDMHNEVCRNRGRLVAAFNSEVEQLDAPLLSAPVNRTAVFGASAAPPVAMATVINKIHAPAFEPVPIQVGANPGYAGVVAQARPAHSVVGTEPDPAIAYAAAPAALAAPFGVDANALPLKGRGRSSRGRAKGRTLKASAEAPTPKVLATKVLATKVPATPEKGAESEEAMAPSPPHKAGKAKPVRTARAGGDAAEGGKPAGDKGAANKPMKKAGLAVPPPKRGADAKPAPAKSALAKPVSPKPVSPKPPVSGNDP